MNYGLYLSAAGVLTNRHRQDVFANNLANVQTHAFKPLRPSIANRPPESIENPDRFGTAQKLLDRLGGGVLAGKQALDFTPGPIESTGNPLDAAITERDQFFAVSHRNAVTGQLETRLTRDGRFTLNNLGELVTQSGHRVLDTANQPILLSADAKPRITPAGIIVDQQNNTLAQLQIARVPAPGDALLPAGEGTFRFKGADTRQPVTNADLATESIEASGTQAVPTLMQLIAASKSAMGNANMIRYHDTLIDRAVNTLGRVA
ncbi:MAG: flagellar hook-basal body complex protein [Planctomycetota bacterium]